MFLKPEDKAMTRLWRELSRGSTAATTFAFLCATSGAGLTGWAFDFVEPKHNFALLVALALVMLSGAAAVFAGYLRVQEDRP